MKKSTKIALVIIIIVIIGIFIYLTPHYLRRQANSNYLICIDNCKRIGLAIEMYATLNDGFYPERLLDLQPNYIFIPDCPSKKQDTYSESYEVSKDLDAFTFCCSGHNHGHVGLTSNYPRYSSNYGLCDKRDKTQFDSPLSYATCKRGYSSIKRFLERHKFADKEMNEEFYSSLHYRKDVALLLLKNGVNINHTYKKGDTWLHLAILYYGEEKDADTIKFLLDNGADPTIKNKEGKTPIDYAIESKDQRIIDLLKSYKIKKKETRKE